MMIETSWRDRLRALPVYAGELPGFDTDSAPAAPTALFEEWLSYAIDSGVAQPQAATLATASESGVPASRTLILKDLDDEGVWFAGLSNSPKGRDLAANPRASLTLYWREQGRQIRVNGTVEQGSRDLAVADFLARSLDARAAAIVGPESEVLPSRQLFDERIADAKAILDFRPDYVPDEWTAWVLQIETIEFWQASPERDQIRLRYTREGSGWRKGLLWP
jgi:pyridoxamine 5'-phosphate oxidase